MYFRFVWHKEKKVISYQNSLPTCRNWFWSTWVWIM